MTACGAEPAPAEEADPPQTVQPEEQPPVPPEETLAETAPSGASLPPLEGTPLTEEELARVNEAFNSYAHPANDKALELGCFFTSTYRSEERRVGKECGS